MPSQFRLQIVRVSDGEVVQRWAGGDPVEVDLVDAVMSELAAGRHIGVAATTKTVESAVRAAWQRVLFSLKSQVRPSRRE